MKTSSLFLLLPVLGTSAAAEKLKSTWMIESIISRNQGVVSSGAATSTLEAGILSLALEAWLEQYPTSNYRSTVSSYLDQVLASIIQSFPNATVSAKMPLDRLSVGQTLLAKQSRSLTVNETHALSTLSDSLAIQARNPAGGFWYYVYPEWSYLDGTVSFLPFMLSAGWSHADALNQITLLANHTIDVNGSSGLFVHGYDFNKTASWANPATGGSPYVWGRSLGWYLAGLVNGWESLMQPFNTDLTRARGNETTVLLGSAITTQARDLMTSLVQFADNATGAWWQLPTFPGREGNFLESSATALYTFSMLKAVRLGIAPRALVNVAHRAYNYTWESFVIHSANGTLGYNGTVAVCSLNSTATYEYYTQRPLVLNSLLGEAAFVLASLEVERGLAGCHTTFGEGC